MGIIDGVISHVLKLNEKEQAIRLAICTSCQSYNRKYGSCSICGCNSKLKSASKRNHCPVKKW